MNKLKEKLMLSEKGYSDLKKAITACTITNIVLLSFNGGLPTLLGVVKAIYWRNNFVGRIVEIARLGAGGGYSGVSGREKRL